MSFLINFFRRKFVDKGFSLIELLCVVAIVSVLASMSLNAFKTFVFRARQVESTVNLRHLIGLSETYISNAPSGVYSNGTNDVYSGANTCNVQNPLGFALRACQRVRYRYLFSGNSTSWMVWALEGGYGGPHNVYWTHVNAQHMMYPATGAINRRVFTGCQAGFPDVFVSDSAAKGVVSSIPWNGRDSIRLCPD